MYSEKAYNLAFPDDPIKKHFESIYKEIDDKYRPIIAEYNRLLKQFNTDSNDDVVHNEEQKKRSSIFNVLCKFFVWIIEKLISIFEVKNSYPDLAETKFPECNVVQTERNAEEERTQKLREYCLNNLSYPIDKSLPYEIKILDRSADYSLANDQIAVYCYIPNYNLIKSIQMKIDDEQNNPTSDITYAYGGIGNEIRLAWSTKLYELRRGLDEAKNNLTVVYREVMYVNPILFVEAPIMPTATTRG